MDICRELVRIAKDIEAWIDDPNPKSKRCPKCGRNIDYDPHTMSYRCTHCHYFERGRSRLSSERVEGVGRVANVDNPNYTVYLWPGEGYQLYPVEVTADSDEEALEKAVAQLEKDGMKGFLLDVAETEEEGAKDGIFDLETGEGSREFDETYLYVDATMEGASKPYYIFSENLRIEKKPSEG